MKMNSNFKTFAGMNFDATKYIPSPSYGVNRFMLDRIGSERARATTIVEYKPNSKFPEHEHIGGEEFLVLEGTFKDQFGEFTAGTYVRNPIGSKHSPWVDDDGCTILVKLLQMAEIPGEGTEPYHVLDAATNNNNKKNNKEGTTNTASSTDGFENTSYGSIHNMYSNDVTGERVQMCWVDPGKTFPTDSHGIDGGEELFVYDGSLVLGETTNYMKWGWLRFPSSSSSSSSSAGDDNSTSTDNKQRATLKAGANGATVYRKTGHLTDKAMSMEKIQITED